MFLEWQSIYSVNIKELDEQHKKIFEIINRVHNLKKELSKKEVLEVLQELKNYASYHLETEEKYFKQFNYPEQEIHIKQHNEYRKKVSEIYEIYSKSDAYENMNEVSDFLRNWWLNHIQNLDLQYSDFLNLNGIY